MYSNYFVKFFLSLIWVMSCLSLDSGPFSKDYPPIESSWPTLWVQESARIRPIETAAIKWWDELEVGRSAQSWSHFHVGEALEPWQIWLGAYFSELQERENLSLFKLDSILAKHLNLSESELYSYKQLEKAQKESPAWLEFTKQLVYEAFEKHQKMSSRFQTASKRQLIEVDESLTAYLDGDQLKIIQRPSHSFLENLPLSFEIQAKTHSHYSYFESWQKFLLHASRLGLIRSTNTLKLPIFVDSAKSIKWYEPKEVFLSKKSILGFSPKQQQEVLELWNQDSVEAWKILAHYVQQSQNLLAQNSQRLPQSYQNILERFYYKTPLLPLVVIGYFLSALARLTSFTWLFHSISLATWLAHTLLLALRILILSRPPVANMEETTLYVPWVAATVAIFLQFFFKKTPKALSALYFTCGSLLAAIYVLKSQPGLEVIPAVLNSQLWLTIHVLMVVGSYAFFLIASVISHTQLPKLWRQTEVQHTPLVLGSMAIGTLLLTSGTLLGAVWAAQSWGRFWDWDPKESWAFISCSLYLLIFHAWAFKKIRPATLHLLAIAGFWVISFTWYGVNFLIATGLHSYGFGVSPYTWIYLFLLSLDALILSIVAFRVFSISSKWNTKT